MNIPFAQHMPSDILHSHSYVAGWAALFVCPQVAQHMLADFLLEALMHVLLA